jgi:hypothetical protein
MTQLEHDVFHLDLDTRAQLAEKLILNIDVASEGENLQLWVAEEVLQGFRAAL